MKRAIPVYGALAVDYWAKAASIVDPVEASRYTVLASDCQAQAITLEFRSEPQPAPAPFLRLVASGD